MLRHPDDALGQDLDALVVGPGIGDSERAEAGRRGARHRPALRARRRRAQPDLGESRAAPGLRAPQRRYAAHAASRGSRAPARGADRGGASRPRQGGEDPGQQPERARRAEGQRQHPGARDGHWFVNASGNPGMASAGMGDVLAGILGALLAQRYSGESSLVLGVHLHGAAADALVEAGIGPVGLTASEVIEAARRCWNAWLSAPAALAPGPSARVSSFDPCPPSQRGSRCVRSAPSPPSIAGSIERASFEALEVPPSTVSPRNAGSSSILRKISRKRQRPGRGARQRSRSSRETVARPGKLLEMRRRRRGEELKRCRLRDRSRADPRIESRPGCLRFLKVPPHHRAAQREQFRRALGRHVAEVFRLADQTIGGPRSSARPSSTWMSCSWS